MNLRLLELVVRNNWNVSKDELVAKIFELCKNECEEQNKEEYHFLKILLECKYDTTFLDEVKRRDFTHYCLSDIEENEIAFFIKIFSSRC